MTDFVYHSNILYYTNLLTKLATEEYGIGG